MLTEAAEGPLLTRAAWMSPADLGLEGLPPRRATRRSTGPVSAAVGGHVVERCCEGALRDLVGAWAAEWEFSGRQHLGRVLDT